MAWSSLSSNQMVTEGDMAQSGISLKANQTHGSGNKCMTKLELLNKYNLDVEQLTSYSDSQLVQRQNIIVSELEIRYSYGISMGLATSSSACNLVTYDEVFINSLNPNVVDIGDVCYTSASGYTVFVGNPYKWYKIDNGVSGAYAVQIDANGLISSSPYACFSGTYQ